MKTLSEIRQSDSYKKLMNELKTGKKEAKEVSWRNVQNIAQEYSYLCWLNGNHPEEKLTRALAYRDFIANEAI